MKGLKRGLGLLLLGSWCVVMAAEPPNIVLIMADDLGYECIGVNGAEDYQTPNVDRRRAGSFP